MTGVEEVLSFWFGDSDDELLIIKQYGKLWFGKDEQVDREIARRFADAVGAADHAAMGHGTSAAPGDDAVADADALPGGLCTMSSSYTASPAR